jgi:hypothetical protein
MPSRNAYYAGLRLSDRITRLHNLISLSYMLP